MHFASTAAISSIFFKKKSHFSVLWLPAFHSDSSFLWRRKDSNRWEGTINLFFHFLFVCLFKVWLPIQNEKHPMQVSYYHQKRQKKKMTLYKNEKSWLEIKKLNFSLMECKVRICSHWWSIINVAYESLISKCCQFFKRICQFFLYF